MTSPDFLNILKLRTNHKFEGFSVNCMIFGFIDRYLLLTPSFFADFVDMILLKSTFETIPLFELLMSSF